MQLLDTNTTLTDAMASMVIFSFLRACTLVQKSYCYTPGVGVGVSVGVHMQNVRANVKVLEF